MAPATVQALQSHGFTTLAHLAYAVGQPGQVIPETEFNTFFRNHVPGPSSTDVPSVRRLLFEGQTLALQQLRLQLTEPESTAKRVPEAERDRRMALGKCNESDNSGSPGGGGFRRRGAGDCTSAVSDLIFWC